uniref:DUF5641 domain-containing protein n=1 Tax=Acrobeloides nanus TaxID=290746 RepID=A0A914CM12_9BILA
MSRPLTYMSDDLDDCRIICPINFVNYKVKTRMLADFESSDDPLYQPPIIESREQELRNKHRLAHKQPKNAVLRPPAIEEVVIIYQEMAPRAEWRLGRVISLRPSSDDSIEHFNLPPSVRIYKQKVGVHYWIKTNEHYVEADCPGQPYCSTWPDCIFCRRLIPYLWQCIPGWLEIFFGCLLDILFSLLVKCCKTALELVELLKKAGSCLSIAFGFVGPSVARFGASSKNSSAANGGSTTVQSVNHCCLPPTLIRSVATVSSYQSGDPPGTPSSPLSPLWYYVLVSPTVEIPPNALEPRSD